MRERIQYQDNLFYISLQIKGLQNGMNLQIDESLFKEKLEGDILFLNEILQKIQGFLKESPHLIRRAEHLHSLMKTKTLYSDMLEEILSDKLAFSENLQDIKGRLQTLFTQQRRDINYLRDQLDEETRGTEENEDIISEAEMQFLFTPDSDD